MKFNEIKKGAMRKYSLGIIGGLAMMFASAIAFAVPAPVYVGSFNVFDGSSWQVAPEPLSAREAAALNFGGSFNDYAISVVNSSDAATITHTAWLDGYADDQYLITPASEDFVMKPLSGKYDDYPAYSAFVCDHADCVADGFSANAGWSGLNYTNYVWRVSPAPEPSTLLLLSSGIGLCIARKRKHKANDE